MWIIDASGWLTVPSHLRGYNVDDPTNSGGATSAHRPCETFSIKHPNKACTRQTWKGMSFSSGFCPRFGVPLRAKGHDPFFRSSNAFASCLLRLRIQTVLDSRNRLKAFWNDWNPNSPGRGGVSQEPKYVRTSFQRDASKSILTFFVPKIIPLEESICDMVDVFLS